MNAHLIRKNSSLWGLKRPHLSEIGLSKICEFTGSFDVIPKVKEKVQDGSLLGLSAYRRLTKCTVRVHL